MNYWQLNSQVDLVPKQPQPPENRRARPLRLLPVLQFEFKWPRVRA